MFTMLTIKTRMINVYAQSDVTHVFHVQASILFFVQAYKVIH